MCTAICGRVDHGGFRARGGVELVDGQGKPGAGAVDFLVDKGSIDFGNDDGIGGQKHAWLERLEPELFLGMRPGLAGRVTA